MSNPRRFQHLRPAATPLAALCAALFIVLALVAPVLAVQGPTKLFDPTVSPRTGSPTTKITFTVDYRNREGSAPDHVSVVIDGTAHRMTGDGGTSWKSGVLSHFSTTLAVGTHTVSFEAMSRDRFSDAVAAGTVTITAPPKPTPTPTPRPDPTPKPTTRPDPTPTPAPTDAPQATPSAGGDGTGSTGAGGSGNGDGGTDSANPSAGPDGSGGVGGTGATGGDATDPTGPDGTSGSGGFGIGTSGGDTGTGATPGQGSGNGSGGGTGPLADPGAVGGPGTGSPDGDPSAPNGDGAGRGTMTGGPGWGAFASALRVLGIDRPPSMTMLPMLVGTSTAMAMAFAFAIFGKKRRDEEPPAPDEVLQANAARGHGSVPGSEVVHGVVRAANYPAPLDLEAGMPRWRRPSLLEARKADPNRSAASSHHMSFDSGAVGVADGRERRTIRYAVVRLLDAPDELRSAEIGQLDQGDEVQLIERSGSYWLVLCPDGRQGWLHKMTLGDVVTDAAPTIFGRDIDDDVLSAFLTARARA